MAIGCVEPDLLSGSTNYHRQLRLHELRIMIRLKISREIYLKVKDYNCYGKSLTIVHDVNKHITK